MSEQIIANITVNLIEGSFSISGSEIFVEKNRDEVFKFLERNKEGISDIAVATRLTQSSALPIQSNVTSQTEELSKADMDKYVESGVYHIDTEDGTISILKKVPGNSKSEKAKNIALIVLYIKNDKISNKVLIPICEKHSCYDSANFASWFRNEKTNIIRKGSGQSWTLELTQPGEKAALELLEVMVNATK